MLVSGVQARLRSGRVGGSWACSFWGARTTRAAMGCLFCHWRAGGAPPTTEDWETFLLF